MRYLLKNICMQREFFLYSQHIFIQKALLTGISKDANVKTTGISKGT